MKREWTVYLTEDLMDAEGDVRRSVDDLTTCLLRLGGVGAISPVRRGVRDDEGHVEYVNIGVHFKYDSYAPGINPDPEAAEEVPVLSQEEELEDLGSEMELSLVPDSNGEAAEAE